MNDRGRFKILIVDDERSNIIALNNILRPTYSTLVAINGQTAIKMTKENPPDLILLDVVMPDMSGFEVLDELKRDDFTRRIPVIFITGLDSAEDEEKGFFLGAVDYITKPFHDVVVKARVKTHLQMEEYIRTIERLGMLDTLTNIPNRRSFDSRIKEEWRRVGREKEPLSILMIDIDKFKNYNDTYGHQQGDLMLQAATEIFRQALKRGEDYIARWGGEEFAVLLPNTELLGALAVAEQIRAGIENMVVLCGAGTETRITVSIGVSTIVPFADDSIEDFIDEADKALYTAKESGRNRVVAYKILQ